MKNEMVVFEGYNVKINRTEIGSVEQDTINARDLHFMLDNGKQFNHWITAKIARHGKSKSRPIGFEENVDYVLLAQKGQQKGRGGHNEKSFNLSLSMALDLAMLEGSHRGDLFRQRIRESLTELAKYKSPETSITNLCKEFENAIAMTKSLGYSGADATQRARDFMLEQTSVDCFVLFPGVQAEIEFKKNSFSISQAAKLLKIHQVVIKSLLESTGVYFKTNTFPDGHRTVKLSTGRRSGPYIASDPEGPTFLLNKLGLEMLAHVNKNGFREWDFETHQPRPEQNLIEM